MFEAHAALIQHGSKYAGSLIRRGLESVEPDKEVNINIDIPGWGAGLIVSTILIAALVLASVRYTLHGVVATLAIVTAGSEPVVPAAERPLSEKDEKDEANAPLLPSDLEATAVAPERITSKIRTTVRHITKVGGWRARWRGLTYYIMQAVASGVTRKGLLIMLSGGAHPSVSVGFFAAHFFSAVVAAVVTAKLHMLWCHSVLTVPGTQGLSSVATFDQAAKKLAPALAINTVATELMIGGPFLAVHAYNVHDKPMEASSACMVLFYFLVVAVGLWFPSYVALIRVEASMLPENVETMVPFDRTFGGKVVADAEGRPGHLTVTGAWQSVSTIGKRLRLLGMFAKIGMVEVVLNIFFGCLIIAQVLLFVSPKDLEKIGQMMQRAQ